MSGHGNAPLLITQMLVSVACLHSLIDFTPSPTNLRSACRRRRVLLLASEPFSMPNHPAPSDPTIPWFIPLLHSCFPLSWPASHPIPDPCMPPRVPLYLPSGSLPCPRMLSCPIPFSPFPLPGIQLTLTARPIHHLHFAPPTYRPCSPLEEQPSLQHMHTAAPMTHASTFVLSSLPRFLKRPIRRMHSLKIGRIVLPFAQTDLPHP
jgi:hypothetical protein